MGMGEMDAGTMSMNSMQAMMKTMMPALEDVASTKEFKRADIDMKMRHDMALPYAGNADVDCRTRKGSRIIRGRST
jgi:hypothetical protein